MALHIANVYYCRGEELGSGVRISVDCWHFFVIFSFVIGYKILSVLDQSVNCFIRILSSASGPNPDRDGKGGGRTDNRETKWRAIPVTSYFMQHRPTQRQGASYILLTKQIEEAKSKQILYLLPFLSTSSDNFWKMYIKISHHDGRIVYFSFY